MRKVLKQGFVVTFSSVCILFGIVAKGDLFVVPSVTMAAVHDGNIFFDSVDPVSDLYLRVSPAIETGYESRRLDLRGRHTFDIEEYSDHPNLDSTQARRRSELDIEYDFSRRLALSAAAVDTTTRTAGELNPDTGLEPGRFDASRTSFDLAVDYRFSQRIQGMAAVGFAKDQVGAGIGAETDDMTLGMNWRGSDNDNVVLAYNYSRYRFDNGVTTNRHLPRLAWTRKLNERTTLTLAGGPVFSNGRSTDVELELYVLHEYLRGEVSARYLRTHTTLIGEAGVFNSDTVTGSMTHAVGPNLDLGATSTFSEVDRMDSRADILRVSLHADYELSRVVSFRMSYDYSLQRHIDSSGDIRRSVILIGVVFTYPGNTQRHNLVAAVP